ncbi:MAG: RluA family pseudouridine synthase [Candidatus Pacebacteria bacterium]|nr:RluA family pseudouridine synthase [Candidatus Paceibacterota bacterium]MBP9839761.1 RluA family pseudouridine synthase [Candidatus Paceibacterota bacterium]
MKIKILYEDKDILVIDKPEGIAVHPDGRSKAKTITDWVVANYPKLKGVGEPIKFNDREIDRPGIVHRLDKETSGVLVVVKNAKVFEYFKQQFMDRKIKKVYHAVVSGWPKNDKGVINKPIGRSPSDFRRRLAGRGARGELREAVTEYKVLKRFSDKKKNKFSYLEIYPKTGRTHQIRVHMKFLSFPVVGDMLYAPNMPVPSPIKRMMLHAKSIEFKNPKGKSIKIESDLPKEFKGLIK